MRGDMSKVIVERARFGGGPLRKGRLERDDDLSLSKIGMKRDARLRGGFKMLNENLNPLKRYLDAQVGRPWNKVWSEICENLKPDNTVQQHVRDHIPDFVAIKTSLRGGEVFVHDRFRFAVTPLKDSFAKLFVDPKSGLLRRNKHWRGWQGLKRASRVAEAKALEARLRVISVTKQLHLLDDGAWWEVTLAKVPTAVEERKTSHGTQRYTFELGVDDVVLRAGLSKLDREKLYGRAGVFAVSKRQLSKKDMRALKLR
jgi:hypothetical protein